MSEDSKSQFDRYNTMYADYTMETYARYPVLFERGEGCRLWDSEGSEYIDWTAGIAVCTLGYGHPVITAAVTDQVKSLHHVSNLYFTRPQGELAQWLVHRSFADRVFFCNSGAEANEGAIRLARKFGRQKRGITDPVIISAANSFHGRTLGALSATGQAKYQASFTPLVPGFHVVPFNDIESLTRIFADSGLKDRIVAFLIEPVQGEGGVTPAEPEYLEAARRLCTSHNALLIFDEIQCGVGRTGTFWAYEQYHVTPDILTSAKGLGGGIAIGALLAADFCACFEPGDHASTFGGNPLACRVARAVCEEVSSDAFLSQVQEVSRWLREELLRIVSRRGDLFSGVRGKGLMLGITLRDETVRTSQEIVKAALAHRLLVIPAGPKVVRIVPPLVLSGADVEEGLARLEAALGEVR